MMKLQCTWTYVLVNEKFFPIFIPEIKYKLM